MLRCESVSAAWFDKVVQIKPSRKVNLAWPQTALLVDAWGDVTVLSKDGVISGYYKSKLWMYFLNGLSTLELSKVTLFTSVRQTDSVF